MIAVLFIILVLCLFIGVPVGFSIGISAMSFLAVSQFTPVTIMAQRLVDGLNSFPLLALPFFILAGEIMSYGCTPRLMRLANLFLGKKPGGLCAAGITASAFFGAISGSGVACTAAIGGYGLCDRRIRHSRHRNTAQPSDGNLRHFLRNFHSEYLYGRHCPRPFGNRLPAGYESHYFRPPRLWRTG